MSYFQQYDRLVLFARERRLSHVASLPRDLVKAKFEISIGPPPHKRNPCHPVLAVDRLASPDMFFRRQNARRRGRSRSSDPSTDGARRHLHPRIVANPFCLPHIAAGHHVELTVFLSEPYRSRDANSGLAQSCKRNIFPTLNGGGNLARHALHSKRPTGKSQSRLDPWRLALSSVVRNRAPPIAPVLSS